MDQVIESFNSVAIQLLTELRKIIPHSVILGNVDLIKSTAENEKSKHMLIDNFVLYVLKYKDEIDDDNEDFFLKHSFSAESEEGAGILKIINEVKSMWLEIKDPDNKQSIFDYFKVLCFYAEKYFVLVDSS